MFWRIVLSAASAAALTASASAADLSTAPAVSYKDYVPVQSWAGFYVGAHVGYASASQTTADLDEYFDYQAPIINPEYNTNLATSGAFGGAQLGYNVQRGNIVAGVEADFGAMSLSGSTALSHAVNPLDQKASLSTGFYGDLTGRLGYAFGPALLYAKGGLAFLDAQEQVDSPLARPLWGYPSFSDAHAGWTIGAGLEYMLSPSWSVKAEYQHFDFGTTSSSLWDYSVIPHNFVQGATYNFNHELTIDTVKVGVNYHLGCCDAPLK